ncbi:MAG: HAD hydrolase-like protein [Gemmatimonadales bacterium]
MKRVLVLFDIDGTILRTAGAGRRAILRALHTEIDAGPEVNGVRFDGKTDPQIVLELLEAAGHSAPGTPALVERLCDRYLAYLEEELAAPNGGTTLLPGVPELLDQLERESGVLLGLLTGNVIRGAGLKLKSGGLDPRRFAVGAYGSDSGHRPDLPAIAAERARSWFGSAPSGEAVVILGDTPADVTCGRGIGARAIGVATGSYAVADLDAAGAVAAFADFSDTARVIETILCPATNSN